MASCFSSCFHIVYLTPLLLLPITVFLIAVPAPQPPPTSTTAPAASLLTFLPSTQYRRRSPEISSPSSQAPVFSNRIERSESELERELSRARAAIRRAVAGAGRANISAAFPLPRVYRNAAAFHASYIEMEKQFKVYVYEEGEAPLVHTGPCKNIYTTEGRFISTMEMLRLSSSGRYGAIRTNNPDRAHAFFLPFSIVQLVRYIYTQNSHDHTTIRRFVADYINVVASKHPYWNRSAGVDHFMLSCHDWGPHVSQANSDLYGNSIRALCNANKSEGFRPGKDVSIPEINLVNGDMPLQVLSPPMPTKSSPRPLLAFFAGGLHGPIRPMLLHYWKNIDPDIEVHEYLPPDADDYFSYMRRSRFCLCPSGYEVASPRVVEAIYSNCIPVIISEGYVLPFTDVLQWEEFSVSLSVNDIPKMKEILMAIPEKKVQQLRIGIKAVHHHFVLNHPPKRFDVFHMILHSIWLRRLNVKIDMTARGS